MKIETKDAEVEAFKPFKIEITIDSWRELEWLFAISNANFDTANKQIPWNSEIPDFSGDMGEDHIQMTLFQALKKEYNERKPS